MQRMTGTLTSASCNLADIPQHEAVISSVKVSFSRDAPF